MDCYTENVIRSIDRNLRLGSGDDDFDRKKFLDAILRHIEKRKQSKPKESSKTRHGSGLSAYFGGYR